MTSRMKNLRVYVYDKCSTCRQALQFLDKRKLSYQKVSIVENPPTVAELRKMLGYLDGDFKKLFNTSGVQYRELGLSQKVKSMTSEEAIQLLHGNGKLIKRPFFIADGQGKVGFKEEEWK